MPVTTNFMAMAHTRGMDYWAWAPEQDIVSNDHYVDGRLERPLVELSWSADVSRNLAARSAGGAAGHGTPWLLMEHSTSAVNWQPINYAKAPGQLGRNSLAHLARGADGIAFFQWRASLAGAEKFHSGAGPARRHRHQGLARGRRARWPVVTTVRPPRHGRHRPGRHRLRLAGPVGQPSSAAIPTVLFDYDREGQEWYAALWDAGVTVDVVPPDADLSSYAVVVVPSLYSCTDSAAANIAAAARGGAQVVITYSSGIVDEREQVRPGGYPGAFRELLGVRTEEFFPLGPDETVHLDDGTDRDRLDRAAPTSRARPPSRRTLTVRWRAVPRSTRHVVGEGEAWYVATRLDPEGKAAIVQRVCEAARVEPVLDVPAGVEVVRRESATHSFLFVLNHRAEDLTLKLSGHDMLNDEPVDGDLTVGAGAFTVIRERG